MARLTSRIGIRRGLEAWRKRRAPDIQQPLDVMGRRVATGIGAVLLGLIALAFAQAGDWAQHAFDQVIARWPYAPVVMTPAIFALVMYLTQKWSPQARGSGIPQVIAATRDPAETAKGPLISLKTAAALSLIHI